MGSAQNLTNDDFESTIATGVTLADFWAEWCPPCRALGPTIDALADDYADDDSVTIAKVDADSSRELAAQYSVTALPTIILFKDGQVVERFVGMKDKETLAAAIDKALGN